MHTPAPDSPRCRPALAGLVLGLLAAAIAAAPAAADDARVPGPGAAALRAPGAEGPTPWPALRPAPGAIRLIATSLRLNGAGPGEAVNSVGLALSLADDVSLSVAGGFDPLGDGAVGLLAIELRF